MKRSFWITLLATLVLGFVALIAQAAWNKKLADRLDAQQKRPAKGERNLPITNAAKQRQSRQRIERSLADFEALAPVAAKAMDKDQKYKEVFPEFLGSVADLTMDEMVALAGKTPDRRIKSWLMLLAAEQDPLRIYRNEEWKGSLSTAQMAEALASTDPEAALRLLTPLEPRRSEDGSIYLLWEPRWDSWIRVATKSLGSDPEQGLQAFLDIQENLAGVDRNIPMGKWGSLGIPSLPEGSVPAVIEAMSDPKYATIRDELLRLTLTNLMFDGGVPAVIENSKSMDLTPEELAGAIKRVNNLGGLSSDPVGMIEWVSEVRPDSVPATLVDWAEQDMGAATDWLGRQPPSPMRDQAIARFATKAAKLDSASATQWANEIQDAKLREQTLQRVQGR